MKPPDGAYLDELTGAAEKWLRRCNDRPVSGIPTRRADLRVVLAASADVHRDGRGWIIWRYGRQEFTAEPVPAEPTPPGL